MTPAEAFQLIQKHLPSIGSEMIPFPISDGRILRQAVCADRALPPYNRATMDGIAISSAALKTSRTFRVIEEAHAGEAQKKLTDPNAAVLINTGAVIPEGADQVVPREELVPTAPALGQLVDVKEAIQAETFAFIHREGSDCEAGTELLTPGCWLSSRDLGIITSVGNASVLVSKRPRLALISSGDELVEVYESPAPHQIRRSNPHALAAACHRIGVECVLYHLPDDFAAQSAMLPEIVAEHDWLVFSGGISRGTKDFIPEVLTRMGAQMHFQWVKQKPGKPMAFFTMPDGKPIFALPGNPLSTLICFHRYVAPALISAMGGRATEPGKVRLGSAFTFEPPLALFLPVKLENQEGVLTALPQPFSNSGDFISIRDSDGFVELPAPLSHFPAQSTLNYYPWL